MKGHSEERKAQAALVAKGKLRCSKCDRVKPIGEFRAPRAGRNLPQQPCLPCNRASHRERYRANDGIERVYAQNLMRSYGLTVDDYREMERRQGGVCAVCGVGPLKAEAGKGRRLAVDHDHSTGAVRELLCMRCNIIVGIVESADGLLEAAASYVQRHRDKGLVLPNKFYRALDVADPEFLRPSDAGAMGADRAQGVDSGAGTEPEILLTLAASDA